jgi:hypothetical protein
MIASGSAIDEAEKRSRLCQRTDNVRPTTGLRLCVPTGIGLPDIFKPVRALSTGLLLSVICTIQTLLCLMERL